MLVSASCVGSRVVIRKIGDSHALGRAYAYLIADRGILHHLAARILILGSDLTGSVFLAGDLSEIMITEPGILQRLLRLTLLPYPRISGTVTASAVMSTISVLSFSVARESLSLLILSKVFTRR